MRRTGFLMLALLSLPLAPVAQGQNGSFNPDSPGEPGMAPSRLVLQAAPAEGGTTGGEGLFVPGNTVTVWARAASNYVFVRWTDTKGRFVSETSTHRHVKGEGADTLVAHFRYAPGTPAEPQDPVLIQYFHLSVGTTEGGNAYGGGKYPAGSQVWLYCYTDTGFDFDGWYNEAGQLISPEQSFAYTTKPYNETVTPRFLYNPAAPAEPPRPILSHNLRMESTDGGRVWSGSNRLPEGNATTLSAEANTGYEFVRWLKNGEPYTTLPYFSYTMEEADVTFRAEFRFNPGNPSEPDKPTDKKYAYYLMSAIGKPGDLLHYPVYLSNIDPLCDMTFRLTFPEQLRPDLTTVRLTESPVSYTVSCMAESDTSYVFSLTGGKTEAGNRLLLVFDVPVAETLPTGKSWQIKINQVAVTEPDGTRQTASTRNGRIYVYRLGDTNGDGNTDLLDKQNMVKYTLNKRTEVFIKEVSDMNEDGSFDLLDCKEIVNTIINKTD